MSKLKHLIIKDLLGALNESEKDKLLQLKQELQISNNDYEMIKTKIVDPEYHQNLNTFYRQSLYNFRNRITIAATILLPLIIVTALCWLKSDPSNKNSFHLANNDLYLDSIPRLILENGTQINLNHELKDSTLSLKLNPQSRQLIYNQKTQQLNILNQKIKYNTIVVPKGSEFKITLQDGSFMHLNTKTRVRFPDRFTQNCREIFLEEGEIYLTVMRDTSRPFKVHTKHGKIEVLGTTFNVCQQTDKPTEVTLVNGSVKISTKTANVLLRPYEQAIISNNIVVHAVNVEEIICWKDDVFYFHNAPLEVILEKLSDWYDFQVFYQNNSIKQHKFFISIDKYSSVDKILKIIEEVSDIKFKIDKNIVCVSKK